MAYPINPTEFRQPPHADISERDEARFVTFGFNFNNFLPAPPAGGGGHGINIVNTTIAPGSNFGALATYNPTGGLP